MAETKPLLPYVPTVLCRIETNFLCLTVTSSNYGLATISTEFRIRPVTDTEAIALTEALTTPGPVIVIDAVCFHSDSCVIVIDSNSEEGSHSLTFDYSTFSQIIYAIVQNSSTIDASSRFQPGKGVVIMMICFYVLMLTLIVGLVIYNQM